MRDNWDSIVEMNKKYLSMSSEEICEMIRDWRFQKNVPITSLEDEPKTLTTEEFLECERLSNLPLSEKCNYYRDQTNYSLPPKSYGLIMVDGKNFSTRWKNILNKPFDKGFIEDMNEVALYLCANIAGARFAFVQSDEISIAFDDLSSEKTEMYFGGRLNKILPVVASMAATKFNLLRLLREFNDDWDMGPAKYTIARVASNFKLSDFDCKAWTVPDIEHQIAWFFYRQNDCVRNSILQVGNTYFSHKELKNKKTDEIIELLKSEKDVDWHSYSNGEKYGRFCKKIMTDNNRSKWECYSAYNFNSDKESFRQNFIIEKEE